MTGSQSGRHRRARQRESDQRVALNVRVFRLSLLNEMSLIHDLDRELLGRCTRTGREAASQRRRSQNNLGISLVKGALL